SSWADLPHGGEAAPVPGAGAVLAQRGQVFGRRVALVGQEAVLRMAFVHAFAEQVARDLFCERMHESHPQYGFLAHKGYPTPEHLAALREHGASPWHRRSFAPVREVCP
ncbi:hypothetical protein VSS93_28415, partial [Pseudomonas syringae pv. tagetis]